MSALTKIHGGLVLLIAASDSNNGQIGLRYRFTIFNACHNMTKSGQVPGRSCLPKWHCGKHSVILSRVQCLTIQPNSSYYYTTVETPPCLKMTSIFRARNARLGFPSCLCSYLHRDKSYIGLLSSSELHTTVPNTRFVIAKSSQRFPPLANIIEHVPLSVQPFSVLNANGEHHTALRFQFAQPSFP